MKNRLGITLIKREKYIIAIIIGLALLHFVLVFVSPAIHNIIEYPNRSLESTLQTPTGQYITSMIWIWIGLPFLTNLQAKSSVVLSMILSLFSMVSMPLTMIILKKISTRRKIIYTYLVVMQISGLLFPDNTRFFS